MVQPMPILRTLPWLVSWSLALWLTACSSPGAKVPGGELPKVGSSGGLETIVIMGTNDIHGTLLPERLKTREAEGQAPREYESGGIAVMASYINTLRDEYGSHFIWLDGGDEFQGSLESNLERGKSMVQFYSMMGLTAAAIGNHEFDYGPEKPGDEDLIGALKSRMREARYPYLAANIMKRDEKDEHADFPNTYPSRIFPVGSLKVGVIGLSTLDTPTTTRTKNVASLYFADLKAATLREAQALRKDGADLVLITSHVGLRCQPGRVPTAHLVRVATDPQGECGGHDEMVRLLRSLPVGTVDAVVSGHSHTVVHHWVAGVPVIQGGSMGRYFNLIYLTYDKVNRKLVTDRTRIEGPIPVCAQIFKNQGDCNGERPAPSAERGGRGALVANRFHGQPVVPVSAVTAMLDPAIQRAAQAKAEPVGIAARPIEPERFKESPLGTLVAEAVRDALGSDVSVVNAGGLRAPIEQGPILFGDVFRSTPFDNVLVKLHVSGQELLNILRVGLSGSRGFTPIAGLRARVIAPEYDAPANDLNHDGKTSLWEVNRIIDVRFSDGSKIDPKKMYTLGTIDFLVGGGDDIGWAMTSIPESRQDYSELFVRASVVQYMKKLMAKYGSINSAEHPILDPLAPRIRFEAPPKKASARVVRKKPSSRKAKPSSRKSR